MPNIHMRDMQRLTWVRSIRKFPKIFTCYFLCFFYSGEPGEGDYSPERHRLNRNGLRRDTVMVQEWSWLVIKFIADNPGVWAFHCHIDWHNLAGMALTFVEAPDVARAKLRVPAETRKVCKQHGIIIWIDPVIGLVLLWATILHM